MTPARRVCLTVHAERLHEPRVWQAVQALLAQLERRRGHATFFVSPLRASLAGIDLAPRLRELTARGHEVGQHTHYYALRTDGTFEKRTDASPTNLQRCLDHDHARLLAAGIRPRGFVSGAWAIHPQVHAWLVANDFAYDVSYRSFPLRYASPTAATGNDCHKPFLRDGLLHIPTTAPLARALRQELRGRPHPPHALWYVHDYDLPHLRHRLALRALDHLLGDTLRVTVSELQSLVAATATHRSPPQDASPPAPSDSARIAQ